MKILYLLFCILLLSLAVSAQTNNINIKGVEVGISYSTVIKKLGKPISGKKGGSFPCDNGKMLSVYYKGLNLKFIESYPKKHFFVASVEITSSKWSVSGIKIGASLKEVKTKFAGKLRKDGRFEVFGGFIKDGFSYFFFLNNRLVKIVSELNVC
jgi:hypothetical protein